MSETALWHSNELHIKIELNFIFDLSIFDIYVSIWARWEILIFALLDREHASFFAQKTFHFELL